MKNIGKRLILISFILAVISSVFIFIYLKPTKVVDTGIKNRTILVAAEIIPERTLIEKRMVKEIEVPDNEIFNDYIVVSTNIVGKYTKESILINEGFHKDKLLNETTNELSMKIEGNNRAISINVSGSTGVSDLIKQGDFVDVVMFLPEKQKGQDTIARPDLTKMLLQNIQVLAVDKSISRNDEQRVEMPSNYLVTLAVPIYDIEKLVLAEDIGQLKLVLRPLQPDDIHKTEGATWKELIIDDFKELMILFPNYKIKSQEGNKIEKVDYDKYIYYVIKQGDTLRNISTTFYGGPEKYTLLKQVNGIWDENLIKTGTGIKIPVLEK